MAPTRGYSVMDSTIAAILVSAMALPVCIGTVAFFVVFGRSSSAH